MKFTILLKNEDDSIGPLTLLQIERKNPLTAATLGLTVAESKQVLTEVQQELVEAQLRGHAQAQRICPQCQSRRTLKDYHSVCLKSLFGGVDPRVPRFNACSCEDTTARTETVRIDGLANWVSPELEFVQSQLAATIPYARTGAIQMVGSLSSLSLIS